MRGFRSDRVNFADTRIAYTLLIAIAAVCTVMGVFASQADHRLRDYELDSCYSVLAECADSLDAWSSAELPEDKLAAALRFRNAVISLPADVALEPLLVLAESLRTADDRTVYNARALADTFALLAAFEYPDGKTASEMVAMTLESVGDEVLIRTEEAEEAEPSAEATAALDTTRYSLHIAEHVMASLFGDSGQAIECEATDDGSAWIARTENLRMVFSSFDGSLESFVYIRLGETPEASCSDAELVERSERFADDKLRLGKVTSVNKVDQLGGFSVMELNCKKGDYRAVLDHWGRVWSMVKVKR